MGGVTHEEFAQTKRGISERTEEKKRERGRDRGRDRGRKEERGERGERERRMAAVWSTERGG